uniref:Glutathione S-transferase LANCL1 n=2 Tax=Salmoninae TaxID=504568 RepID=A0A8K9Y491_ONCMY
MDQRAWKNPYADYDGNPASVQELFDSQGKLTAEFAGRLSNAISQLLMHMENGLKSADPRDCTGYTGWAGEEEEPTILLFLGFDYILSPQITSLLNSVPTFLFLASLFPVPLIISHPLPPLCPLPCPLSPSSSPPIPSLLSALFPVPSSSPPSPPSSLPSSLSPLPPPRLPPSPPSLSALFPVPSPPPRLPSHSPGIALLYLHLHGVFGEPSFLQKALDYVGHSLTCPTRRRDVTFLCGDAGPLAVAAVVYHRVQRAQESDECLSRLLQLHQSVVMGSGASGLPDELLYGRMGYLYALTFINQQFGHDKIPIQYIQQICEAVLISGEGQSQRFRCQDQSPLMYEWYQEQYVGPAHGLAGIYYFLMQPGYVAGDERVHRLVRPSVDHVCRLRFPTGNYPPCIGDNRDLLVHWCHGAPGIIYMLLQAYKVFGVGQYLEEALQCGEVVWHRGLLKKGYGLCHGAAGNAYAFLALYKLTHDPKHLYRACMFADWCMNYGKHGCRTPDTPFSLFEGMAGTIYFLADLLQPLKSKFPAFEV